MRGHDLTGVGEDKGGEILVPSRAAPVPSPRSFFVVLSDTWARGSFGARTQHPNSGFAGMLASVSVLVAFRLGTLGP
jgi:hypothetical protein